MKYCVRQIEAVVRSKRIKEIDDVVLFEKVERAALNWLWNFPTTHDHVI